jgi:hypothetical protein
MPNSVSCPKLTRRRFAQLSGMALGSLALSDAARATATPDVTLEVAPYTLEAIRCTRHLSYRRNHELV